MTLHGPFICPRCGKRSEHPVDLAEGYCGRCHDFTARPVVDVDGPDRIGGPMSTADRHDLDELIILGAELDRARLRASQADRDVEVARAFAADAWAAVVELAAEHQALTERYLHHAARPLVDG